MGHKVYTDKEVGSHFLIPSNHKITPHVLKIAFKLALANKVVKHPAQMSRTKLLEVTRYMFQNYGDQALMFDEPEVMHTDLVIRTMVTKMFPELHDDPVPEAVPAGIVEEAEEQL